MAKPCTPHPIPQAEQLFKIETANVNAFLLDGHRPFSFNGKKMGGALGSSALALHFPSALCAERHSPFGDKKENLSCEQY